MHITGGNSFEKTPVFRISFFVRCWCISNFLFITQISNPNITSLTKVKHYINTILVKRTEEDRINCDSTFRAKRIIKMQILKRSG